LLGIAQNWLPLPGQESGCFCWLSCGSFRNYHSLKGPYEFTKLMKLNQKDRPNFSHAAQS